MNGPSHFIQGLVPFARISFRLVAAGTIQYVTLGPFPAYGLLEAIGWTLGSDTDSGARLSFGITPSPSETQENFERSSILIDQSDVVINNRQAIFVDLLADVPWTVPYLGLFSPFNTGPQYVIFAIQRISGGTIRFTGWAKIAHVIPATTLSRATTTQADQAPSPPG